MTSDSTPTAAPSPLQAELLPDGAIVRLLAHGVMLNLFPATWMDGGLANLWLRLHGADGVQAVPLLGPRSPLSRRTVLPAGVAHAAAGRWQGLQIRLQLQLAADEAVMVWHVDVHNDGPQSVLLDALWVQDVGLAAPEAIRLNEHYVSHYIDLSPLQHGRHGTLLAARQNQPVQGRHPWLLAGSLGRAVSFATDAWQVLGLGPRAGGAPVALAQGLPGQRLQHEHALVALQDEPQALAPGRQAGFGYFALALADHPAASGDADLTWAERALQLPQAQPPTWPEGPTITTVPELPSLFASAPWLAAQDLDEAELTSLFGAARRHEERDAEGTLLSFFRGDHTHVVLREKDLRVRRPHGHLLHTAAGLVPDETALTSTVWMAGGFHSMLTQGHVSINRGLSTVRGWLSAFRSQGQRVFVDAGQGWQQLGLPSAFEIEPGACRWWYRHAAGLIEVSCRAQSAPHAMLLTVRVVDGAPLRLRVTHHVCLGGDEGRLPSPPLRWRREGEGVGEGVFIAVPPDSELARRFPEGGFAIDPLPGSRFAQVSDDAALFADGVSRGQSWLCVDSDPVLEFGLALVGRLVDRAPVAAEPLPLPQCQVPTASPLADAARQWAEIAPWFRHNALVHYLSPRGLEQFSGGGWGTRDVCQGPLEMLLALDRPAPVRDLLCRVFAAQDASGDWPQWFMFFERERSLRAGDSHGDIVFWPLVGLARYLLASADGGLLDQPLPYHDDAEAETVWQHVERALAVIHRRRIEGTALAAYGHGDWNDSLQPADPALRDHLCSSWTVTLHHQALHLLARALQALGQGARAAALQAEAAAVQADFQRLLVADGVVAGYAWFEPGAAPAWLLHPRDRRTGLQHSLLPMMHAVIENMLSPEQAQAQAALIEQHLVAPDGARLFDRPLPYSGGPMSLFQRAESSAFFGREIGVMYMHAHLRWAEMLAHLGQAGRFLQALSLAHPIGLPLRVPQATRRQANCYYSSSDAGFADRWDAQAHYDRVAGGQVPLDGGWRVYSSGPGIALGLWVGCFLGLRREGEHLVVDPVVPQALAGLQARLSIGGADLLLELQPGPLGHGPQHLLLDGQPLPFERVPNPYRTGAARVPLSPLRQAQAGPRRLVVFTQ